jgi:hypothetical protein
MRTISIGAPVNYVAADGTIKKGKVAKLSGAGAAHIQLSENEFAIADYSELREPGTFHFPDEQRDVASNGKKSATPPGAAASARSA